MRDSQESERNSYRRLPQINAHPFGVAEDNINVFGQGCAEGVAPVIGRYGIAGVIAVDQYGNLQFTDYYAQEGLQGKSQCTAAIQYVVGYDHNFILKATGGRNSHGGLSRLGFIQVNLQQRNEHGGNLPQFAGQGLRKDEALTCDARQHEGWFVKVIFINLKGDPTNFLPELVGGQNLGLGGLRSHAVAESVLRFYSPFK